ncbi:MAG: 23S rRNA (adenine(2503)-C(2))-methyltransferase RlmN [Chlamydiae bacterium]|nr:23S rRNA (adenine(2503)-C(2))-methyltransferase RlmN [Chlamydiota bacterium]
MERRFYLNFTFEDWSQWVISHNYPSFIAKQIFEWILKGVNDPFKFTNIPKDLKEKLYIFFDWDLPKIDTRLESQDKSTKYLLKLNDGKLIEMVLMPSLDRVTLCISSQVGCRMNCSFCQTGKMGLLRNLSFGEILSQILIANNELQNRKVTNIVFMGMGEPLDNFDELVKALKVMTSLDGLNLSKHKVTVSTSGLVPEIEALGKEVAVSLAISFHTPFDDERSSMMPINRKYPLEMLKNALLKYPIQTRHGITLEYVMIKDKNDSLKHAKALVKFAHGLKVKVNLIPLNPHPGTAMEPALEENLKAFQNYLETRSISAPVRYSRGQDVSAACGQLAIKRKEELHADPRLLWRQRRSEERV